MRMTRLSKERPAFTPALSLKVDAPLILLLLLLAFYFQSFLSFVPPAGSATPL